MTNVTYVRQSSMATFTFLILIIYVISEKQSVIHLPTPLENAPTLKLVKYLTFFIWLKVCIVLAFSVLAFSAPPVLAI